MNGVAGKPSPRVPRSPAPEAREGAVLRKILLLSVPLVAGLAACRPPAGGGARVQGPTPVVFFTGESAALGPEARAAVAQAAERARARPGAPVVVRGLAAPGGSPGFGRALSEARARNVADALVAAGVSPDRIRVEPRGPVPYEAMQLESRRVEIAIGG
ncbi:MAG: OmpA family protein [Acetobacteraceae bacterium]|nr:OmpA family protein [Acetobacteraceae bacterium]